MVALGSIAIELMVFYSSPYKCTFDQLSYAFVTQQRCLLGAYLGGSIPAQRAVPNLVVIGVVPSSLLYQSLILLGTLEQSSIFSTPCSIAYFLIHHVVLIVGLLLAIRWPISYVFSSWRSMKR